MPQVNIATSVAPYSYPAGTVLGKFRFQLIQPSGAVAAIMNVDAPLPAVVTFPSVSPGEYTLSIQRLTATGTPTGPAYTAPVTVAAPAPVVGDAPVGADVTVG
jgi:hypothetical protein